MPLSSSSSSPAPLFMLWLLLFRMLLLLLRSSSLRQSSLSLDEHVFSPVEAEEAAGLSSEPGAGLGLRNRLWKGFPVEVVIVEVVVAGVVLLRVYVDVEVVLRGAATSSEVAVDRLECSGGRPSLLVLEDPTYAEPRASRRDEAADVEVDEEVSSPSRVLLTEPSLDRAAADVLSDSEDEDARGSVERSLDVEYRDSTSSEWLPWRTGLEDRELELSRSLR